MNGLHTRWTARLLSREAITWPLFFLSSIRRTGSHCDVPERQATHGRFSTYQTLYAVRKKERDKHNESMANHCRQPSAYAANSVNHRADLCADDLRRL